MEWLQSVGDYFYNLLIYQDRYMTILKGLGNTLVIAAAAGSAICMSRQSAALR